MVIEEWPPVTQDFGIIRAPVELVVERLEAWHAGVGTRYRTQSCADTLQACFEALLPLTHAKTRRLFVATRAGWTACFQNGIDGSDPFPAMSYLARTLGVEAMRVCRTPPGARWPATIWEVYVPEHQGGVAPLGYRRALAASNDGGRWCFTNSGPLFPFEEPARYGARRVRDRFTGEMLAEYLAVGFDLRPFDDADYLISFERPGIVLHQTTNVHRLPEYTLAEVRAGRPWQHGSGRRP
jgi:hypothetical protein